MTGLGTLAVAATAATDPVVSPAASKKIAKLRKNRNEPDAVWRILSPLLCENQSRRDSSLNLKSINLVIDKVNDCQALRPSWAHI
jgi:hypothetical protein